MDVKLETNLCWVVWGDQLTINNGLYSLYTSYKNLKERENIKYYFFCLSKPNYNNKKIISKLNNLIPNFEIIIDNVNPSNPGLFDIYRFKYPIKYINDNYFYFDSDTFLLENFIPHEDENLINTYTYSVNNNKQLGFNNASNVLKEFFNLKKIPFLSGENNKKFFIVNSNRKLTMPLRNNLGIFYYNKKQKNKIQEFIQINENLSRKSNFFGLGELIFSILNKKEKISSTVYIKGYAKGVIDECDFSNDIFVDKNGFIYKRKKSNAVLIHTGNFHLRNKLNIKLTDKLNGKIIKLDNRYLSKDNNYFTI